MWYVLQTKSGYEDSAVEKCGHMLSRYDAGKAFTLHYCYEKKYLGEWHTEKNVLFPGYLFVDSNTDAGLLEEKLKTIPDVAVPVIIGDGFYPVSSDEEDFLKSMSDNENCISMSVGYINSGQLVIEKGPLKGKEESIKKIDRHKRTAFMEISLLHEIRTVKVGLEVKAKTV